MKKKKKIVLHPCVSEVILYHTTLTTGVRVLSAAENNPRRAAVSWYYHEILTWREIISLNKLQKQLWPNAEGISSKCQNAV